MDQPFDPVAAAEVILGYRIARLGDMVDDVSAYLAKLADSAGTFDAAVRAAGGRPAGKGEAAGEAVGYGWNDLGRDVSALLRATVAIANTVAGPQHAEPGAGLNWTNAARPEPPPAPKPPGHWLWDTLERVKKGVGRAAGGAGKRLFGRNAMRVFRRSGVGKAVGGSLRAGVGAAAGRGTAGAMLAGGRAGAILGGAGGPVGMVLGAVSGVLAAGAKSVFDAGVGLFQTLAGSIVRILSPVAVLSRAIASNTSGYGVLNKSVDYLASVIGVMLMPLFLNLAAAVMTVADMLQGPMLEAVRAISGPIWDATVEALALFVTALGVAADMVQVVAAAFELLANSPLLRAGLFGMAGVVGGKVLGSEAGRATAFGAAGAVANGFAQRHDETRRHFGLKADDKTTSGKPGDDKGTGGEWRKRLEQNFKLTEQEFARTLMPRAQSLEIGGINQAATMAGLNMTPFEQKTLEWQMRVLGVGVEVIRGLQEKPRQ